MNYTLLSEKRGQISIFLGITLMVSLTLLAFMVNVGLFVKAKINLQNSVDAGAWAGASVQARQLTNIAYLNWEMRNNYKEWMFKFYVLGQVSMGKTREANIDSTVPYDGHPGGDNVGLNFRLNPFWRSGHANYDKSVYDKYNLPSICIHFDRRSNICEVISAPGLPRFGDVGVPGVGQYHEAFQNSIVDATAKDCAKRSDTNLAVSMAWVYGTGDQVFKNQNIPIAVDRVGAWPASIDMAIRMRNLEMMVNLPPEQQPICLSGEACKPVSDLDNARQTPMYERPVKAFWSAFRNLDNELKGTFKLTEIPPTPKIYPQNTLSTFLIPANTESEVGFNASRKYYLDLQVMPLNLVNFYTTFAPTTGNIASIGALSTEAECGSAKAAIPVPGFILGFVKNPEIMTYYSVKGEAKYVGLFFPFTELEGINLKAYASAKPFGGRIGPRLFSFENNQGITAKAGTATTQPYILGMLPTSSMEYKPGDPIPNSPGFWVSDPQDNIGGIPGEVASKFAIPNLLYDGNYGELQDAAGDLASIQILKPPVSPDEAATRSASTGEEKGLYNRAQFKQLASLLGNGVVTSDLITQALIKVRKPTQYEAFNYLIPALQGDSTSGASPGIVLPSKQDSIGNTNYYTFQLYAPLTGQDTLFPNASDINDVISRYLTALQDPINQFLDALLKVKQGIEKAQEATQASLDQQAIKVYQEAANMIYLSPGTECVSMAGQIRHFFLEQNSICNNIVPLPKLLENYFSEQIAENPVFNDYHVGTYYHDPAIDIMTAYYPAERSGVSETDQRARRNFYSTKFISTAKLLSGGQHSYFDRTIVGEGGQFGRQKEDVKIESRNYLSAQDLSEFNPINH